MSTGRRSVHGLLSAACLALCLLLTACSSSKKPVPVKGSYQGATYTVKRGDTLWRIARISGSSVRELARLNGLRSPYTLAVGQSLRVKPSARSKAASSARTRKTLPARRNTAATRKVKNASAPKVIVPPAGSRCWRWPAKGRVVLPFSRAAGGNKGIDISGQRGAPVYAAGAGRVVYAGSQLRGYGNLILIKHNDDYITAYGHNEKLLVSDGQQVRAGQQIATMGSSGTTSVRLHFQIRYRANAIDPQRYLPPSC
ncbi:peptidoglycan DD-metalloendopeptidase family protein [Enterobacteriaceae bacterium YMB-R22]|uniref:peptidoglycan DD-metalloendopeptidase family protein n=1 Tax=Tenebrionicola larvae TaxID=2815733 RepID=UPI0037D9EFCA|nr:peptidoglycan DD-metalloendopeptidase family protein [Tenebrionicola larvae]